MGVHAQHRAVGNTERNRFTRKSDRDVLTVGLCGLRYSSKLQEASLEEIRARNIQILELFEIIGGKRFSSP
jgi:hypothetical protein